MSLRDLATNGNPIKVSFEFSPPKTRGSGRAAVARDPPARTAARRHSFP